MLNFLFGLKSWRGVSHRQASTIRGVSHRQALTIRGVSHRQASTIRGVSHHQALTIRGVSHYQAKALQYCPSPLRGIVLAAANLPDRPRERPRAPLNNEHGLRG